MTPAQKDHIKTNIKDTSKRMIAKYVEGQLQHKGNLWEKPGMLRNIEDEIADLNHYVPTLRQQLVELKSLLKAGEIKEATQWLDAILSDVSG